MRAQRGNALLAQGAQKQIKVRFLPRHDQDVAILQRAASVAALDHSIGNH